VVAFEDGTPAYTDEFGIVRGQDHEPISEGEIVWVKSRDAPDRDIQFQTVSESESLVGLSSTLDAAWEGLKQVNDEWNDGETYRVTVCWADAELSLKDV
jgi:hypothetical protein